MMVHRSQAPSLGVVAISYNEQQDIVGFLDNLIGWVDEVVVVDDGSTDNTEALCLKAGPKVRFVSAPRLDGEYFSDQRNKGIDAAQSDWLLHMDIDERVPSELAHEVLLAIRNSSFDGYRFRRRNYFMQRPMKGGGWQHWNHLHLARRSLFRFGGMFHESYEIDCAPERIGQLEHLMTHLNEVDFEKRLRKSAVYLEEVVADIERRGTKITATRILFAPLKEFVKKYLLQGGFRDGTPGLISAMHSSTSIFRGYSVVWDRQNRLRREDVEARLKAEFDAGRICPVEQDAP